MAIVTRGAAPADYPTLRSLFSQAFRRGAEDEALLWDYIIAADPGFRPEHVRVALHEGEPAACTVLVPRPIRARTGWVPGAVVTLVACRPDLQGRGYGGAAVRAALGYMAERGLAVGILYGHEGFYPRFGFAPVLPRFETMMLQPGPHAAGEPLAAADASDLPGLAELYAGQCGAYLCTAARSPDPWMWRLRNPEAWRLLVLPDRTGYAFMGLNRDKHQLDVREAAATDPSAARRLLAGLWREAGGQGMDKVRLVLPPDHLLPRLAAATTLVERRHNSARWGMAAIADWRPLLPPDYAVTEAGLTCAGESVLAASLPELVQLAIGYRSPDDLLLAGCKVRHLEKLRRDFPPALPRWFEDPYWFYYAD